MPRRRHYSETRQASQTDSTEDLARASSAHISYVVRRARSFSKAVNRGRMCSWRTIIFWTAAFLLVVGIFRVFRILRIFLYRAPSLLRNTKVKCRFVARMNFAADV